MKRNCALIFYQDASNGSYIFKQVPDTGTDAYTIPKETFFINRKTGDTIYAFLY